jgi:hypothetical protein
MEGRGEPGTQQSTANERQQTGRKNGYRPLPEAKKPRLVVKRGNVTPKTTSEGPNFAFGS